MNNSSVFFRNDISHLQAPDYKLLQLRFQNLQSVSAHLEKTFILTDLYKEQLMVYNSCTQLSNIFGTSPHSILKDETELTQKIAAEFRSTFDLYIQIISSHIATHAQSGENTFYFSFKTPFLTADHQTQTVTLKIFPYSYIPLPQGPTPWINFYQCEPCDEQITGQLTLYNLILKNKTHYLLNSQTQDEANYIILKEPDLNIFELACQGFSETEIASKLNISLSSLKRTKAAIMTHINAQSTAQTIAILHEQGFL